MVLCIFAKPLISLFGLSAESAGLARQIILLHSLAAGIIWPIGFVLPSAFRAAGDVKFSMVASMSSMWVFRVGLGYLLVSGIIPGLSLGIWGVWLAMLVDWLFRTVLYFIRYHSGKWLHVGSIK